MGICTYVCIQGAITDQSNHSHNVTVKYLKTLIFRPIAIPVHNLEVCVIESQQRRRGPKLHLQQSWVKSLTMCVENNSKRKQVNQHVYCNLIPTKKNYLKIIY